ncbi:MAG: PBP1A family penicillin-binding protein [Actinobacteria bacterium]|nr:PBP1A family penicillin-binding protein [Actinomycetota bacterium]
MLGVLVAFGLAGLLFVIGRVPLPAAGAQAQTTILTDATGARLASLDSGEDRVAVPLDQVPDVLVDAVLAVEDRKFFEHQGLDPSSIIRATWADIRGNGSLQGGSTITQQYAKTAYVGRERSLWRKLREAIVAVKLERKYDKAEILERYLNAIYFGRGAYGVQAGSRAWFGKDVTEIGLREAAYLAGLIRSPERADFDKSPEEALRRRNATLKSMESAGFIEPPERRAAEAEPLETYVVDHLTREPSVVGAAQGTNYFVEYVRQQLTERFGEAAVFSGGLRVRTTLDLSTQAEAFDAVYGTLDRLDDPAGALVAIDDTGAIRAMVGGRDWKESKVNLAVGREGGGHGRQPGSTFKPFLLAETVRQGYTPESALQGPAEITIKGADAGKPWRVANFEDQAFGAINLIDATRHSVNTVYAQLVDIIGPEAMADMARDLGVTSELSPVHSLVLGTSDVSVLEMARAFATFATRGERVDAHAILEVTTADGRVLERANTNRTRVLDQHDADIVNFALTQVVERGTGTGARFGKPAAGKTGTTQDFGDAWFVGYTPKLSTAVWMGYPEGSSHPMTDVRGQKVTGGSFPATIFRRFMAEATKGHEAQRFPRPDHFRGKVVKGARAEFSEEETTTTSESTTTTEVPESTTTTRPPTTTTTRRPTTTTTRETTTTSSTTTTTEQETTTSTTRPPRTTQPEGGPDP